MFVLACVFCALVSEPAPIDTARLIASTEPGAVALELELSAAAERAVSPLQLPEETRLGNVRQLTFGHGSDWQELPYAANYAEAYWSPDGQRLVLQSTRNEHECDQLFVLDLITGGLELVSTGEGRVTCGFFMADNASVIYSSTHENGGVECPPRPDMSRGYVWPIYPSYDIYARSPDGQLRNLTNSPGYDAEGTIDWNTGWMYFTSTRDNDIDIYRQQLESGEVQRLTDSFGYDGGPFISYDGKTIVFRRQVFADDAERADFSALLAENMVRPSRMELWAMDADGGNQRQLTALGGANFAPFLHPDNDTVIFCSNYQDPRGRTFELYTLSLAAAATGPLGPEAIERVTWGGEFDGFPMFSPDGNYLVWNSNRGGSRERETNVFVAVWLPRR